MAKPGALAILIGGPKKAPPKDSAKDSSGDEGGDDLTMAAEELIKAVKSGDASAVADALYAAHQACSSQEE